MPNTPLLNIPQVSASQNQKEVTINDAIAALEAALCDTLVVSFASATTVALTATQLTRNYIFRAQSGTADSILTLPTTVNGNDTSRIFSVSNETGYGLTVKFATGSGTTVLIPNGHTRLLAASGGVDVKVAAENVTVGNFIGLTDTPSSFAGFAGRLLAVNSSANAVEFIATDLVPDKTGNALKVLRVNSGGTGLEWAANIDAEYIRDTIAASLVQGAGVLITVNDTADTITIAADPEYIRDTIGATLVAGTGVTLTVDDAGNTITIDASTSVDTELVRDTVAAALVAGTNVTIVVDDPGNTITINATVPIDTDATLAANSDTLVPSQKAVKSFVATQLTSLWKLKGSIDASANPNYPAATTADTYFITVAGKVGGASGPSVSVGDFVVATATNVGGTQAAVGSAWDILPHTLAGALLSVNNLSDLTNPSAARTSLGLGAMATIADAPSDGTTYGRKDGAWVVEGSSLTSIYVPSIFYPGVLPTGNLIMLRHTFVEACDLPIDCSGSKGGGTANAAADTVYSLYRSLAASPDTFTLIGTVTYATGTHTPTFATVTHSAYSFAPGDTLKIVGPATPDTTLTDTNFSLLLNRTS